jgi:Rv0623-like transcription factor
MAGPICEYSGGKRQHGRQHIWSISIKSPEAVLPARKLAALTGETIIQAVTVAIRERLARVESGRKASVCF